MMLTAYVSEENNQRLHPKHEKQLSIINERLGGRSDKTDKRSADISVKEWWEAVSDLTVFLRVGGPLPGGRHSSEVGNVLYQVSISLMPLCNSATLNKPYIIALNTKDETCRFHPPIESGLTP